MLIKYKAGDVAKDLGLPNKELLEVITEKFGEAVAGDGREGESDESGEHDDAGLARGDQALAERLVAHVVGGGCGVLVAGTTGEVASLPEAAAIATWSSGSFITTGLKSPAISPARGDTGVSRILYRVGL